MSANILSTYFPEAVSIVLGNDNFSHIVSGVAEGTFITIARETPATQLVIGGDMSAMRVRRKNRASTVTVTLMQGSDSNDVFSQILKNDEDAMNNDWLFHLTIKDGSGRSVFFSPQAYIANMPDISFGTEGDNREWVIQCIDLDSHVGGGGLLDAASVNTLGDVGYDVAEDWKTS